MNATQLVKALGGRGHSARCPAHEDHDPSLSVHDGPGGKLLVRCHAGCDQLAVWSALKVPTSLYVRAAQELQSCEGPVRSK